MELTYYIKDDGMDVDTEILEIGGYRPLKRQLTNTTAIFDDRFSMYDRQRRGKVVLSVERRLKINQIQKWLLKVENQCE